MIGLVRSLRGFAAIAMALALCAATALAYSALPGAWKNWRYSRAIEIAPTDAPRLVEATVADEVFLRSKPSLEDLRIIDEQGNETPYTIFTLDGGKKIERLAATVHEQSFHAR